MTTKQAEMVKKVLAALEKSYGKAGLFTSEEPLNHVVYHLIEGASGKKAAEAGVNRLTKAFVDWNEVRVSSRREIAGCLSEVRREDRSAVASSIKAGLEHLFGVRYRDDFSLGRKLEERDAALAVLADIEGLDCGRAALVLYATRPEGTNVVPFAAIGRILMRIGAVRKTTSTRAVIAAVNELVETRDLSRLTYLLARHGHEVCGVKSYFCTQCAIASLCAMGRRRVRSTRGGRRRAARKARGRRLKEHARPKAKK